MGKFTRTLGDIVNCKYCNIEFAITHGYQKFCTVEHSKMWYKQNYKPYKQPGWYEKQRKFQLNSLVKRRYKITLDGIKNLLIKQNGKCSICEKDISLDLHKSDRSRAIVEHNHETGKVRSLTCQRCNVVIGSIENNQNLIKKVIKYIKIHQAHST